MPPTLIRGNQVLDGSIQRADIDTTTSGQAVMTKVVAGTNVTISSSGVDPGTGDVTINVPGGGVGAPAWTTSTAGFTVPAVGSTVVASVLDTSWVTVGENLWVEDANGVGSSGTLQVSAKTSNSLTLKNVSGAGN